MAKLAALMILLIAVAAATSVSARPRTSSCQMEMEQMMPMEHCMMWMKGKMRSAAANPRFREEQLEKCCDELMEFSSPCRCDAVMEMTMSMQPYGQMEEMERMACSLPSMCGMRECRRCSGRVAA